MLTISQQIATELQVKPEQVNAAIELLDNGATVPFIARYRKEVTNGLDDTHLRNLEERLTYLRELNDRRTTILTSITEQQKLTPSLQQAINAATTKTQLEDLYRPYMTKRRTKAQLAREAGLEPLATALLADPSLDPQTSAANYLNSAKNITDAASALEGARQILMETFSDDAQLLEELRDYAWQNGELQSTVVKDKQEAGAKFSDYFASSEAVKSTPSHRALAMFRGRKEGVLSLKLIIDPDNQSPGNPPATSMGETIIARRFNIQNQGRAADTWLTESVRWAWRVKLSVSLDQEIKKRLRESAEQEAIQVFQRNLHDLLLTAPAGMRTTMGLDPGIRTGVKVAVAGPTGKLLETTTIYPHAPRNQWDQSIHTLAQLAQRHQVELISIGNGTASRETDQLVADLMQQHSQLKLTKLMVSEAGASVYSASELAAHEFPDLDVSLRGAISIARRLQDPLAELVKIEPKAIGIGQYQHDVNQTQLGRSLNHVVEDCVNAVGVDINTASSPLLSFVSGLNPTLADNIVAFRDQHGAFKNRKTLLKVARLGPKAYEQAAGFLRIANGDNPLDASGVHPEAYPVVQRILDHTQRSVQSLTGDISKLRSLAANDFTDSTFGEPTVRDILTELEKPGRDPRPAFKAAVFKEGIHKIGDLKPGMKLEGVITNITNFGAFVDVGVHQDGLVHISALADKFVKDPHSVVKTGDIVNVTVMEVDIARQRIALSMRKTSAPPTPSKQKTPTNVPAYHKKRQSEPTETSMAQAFAKLKRNS